MAKSVFRIMVNLKIFVGTFSQKLLNEPCWNFNWSFNLLRTMSDRIFIPVGHPVPKLWKIRFSPYCKTENFVGTFSQKLKHGSCWNFYWSLRLLRKMSDRIFIPVEHPVPKLWQIRFSPYCKTENFLGMFSQKLLNGSCWNFNWSFNLLRTMSDRLFISVGQPVLKLWLNPFFGLLQKWKFSWDVFSETKTWIMLKFLLMFAVIEENVW